MEGIRRHDPSGAIALFGKEPCLPYDRPPLSKGLWLGKTRLEELPVHDAAFYKQNNVHMALGREISSLDVKKKYVIDADGDRCHYDKLLIATGGSPRTLSFGEGAVHYYRTLEDYTFLREATGRMEEFICVGGGFIGGELAAALTLIGKKVTVVFPDEHLLQKVLPADLAGYVTRYYTTKGVRVIKGDLPTDVTKADGGIHMTTRSGKTLQADMALAAIGLNLHTEMAKRAGLKVENGISVNAMLQTSDPDTYAAGDIALFPVQALGKNMRVEHWDNAREQGQLAGENMAGAKKPYDHLPYFWSDLFDLGFEAVGELDSRLHTFADWKEQFREGVVYFLDEDLVRGVLLWNVWGKVDEARELIQKRKRIDRPENLKGRI